MLLGCSLISGAPLWSSLCTWFLGQDAWVTECDLVVSVGDLSSWCSHPPGAHPTQSGFTTSRDWTRVTTHMFFTALTAERTFLDIRFPIENPIHSVCPLYLFWLNYHKSPYITCRSLSSLPLQHPRKYPNQLCHPDSGGSMFLRNVRNIQPLHSAETQKIAVIWRAASVKTWKLLSLWSLVPCSHCFMKWDLWPVRFSEKCGM